MNHDDTEVERRLILAGTVWRAAEPAPPEPDPALMTRRQPNRRPLLVAAAAAAAAVIGAGAIALLGPGAGPGPTQVGRQNPDRLRSLDQVVIHDGSTVRAKGTVVAAPGKPAVLCLGPALAGAPDHLTCDTGASVRLTGVDLDALGLTESGGARIGTAVLTGTWHGRTRTLAVTSTARAPDPSNAPQLPPLRPPCAAPPGGWHSGPLADRTRLDAYLAAHPDRFGGTDIGFPDGRPGGPTGVNGYDDVAQVIVVGVADHDLAQARADLTERYPGNLCVRPVPYSAAQLNRAGAKVQRAVTPRTMPAFGLGTSMDGVEVYLSYVDDAMYRKLAAIEDSDGIGILHFTTDIVPVH